jgi:nitrite reductase (NO-forming)
MAGASAEQGRSQEPPPEPGAGPGVPAGLFVLFAVMSMLAFAISIVALVVAGSQDDERPATAEGGPVQTVAVELGDLYVNPDRVEVLAGMHLIVEVTNTGDQEHDLNLNGETGTDRLHSGESQTADFGVLDADEEAWCTVPGHKGAGMVLTIAVTSGSAETAGRSTALSGVLRRD